MILYWDSWDRHKSFHPETRGPTEEGIPYHNNNNFHDSSLSQACSVISLSSTSPPSTPLLSKLSNGMLLTKRPYNIIITKPSEGNCLLKTSIYNFHQYFLCTQKELSFQQHRPWMQTDRVQNKRLRKMGFPWSSRSHTSRSSRIVLRMEMLQGQCLIEFVKKAKKYGTRKLKFAQFVIVTTTIMRRGKDCRPSLAPVVTLM